MHLIYLFWCHQELKYSGNKAYWRYRDYTWSYDRGSLAIHEGGIWAREKQPTIICHEFGTNMRFTSRYAQCCTRSKGTPYLYLISVDLKAGLVE